MLAATIAQTTEYTLNLLSDHWSGPVIIFVSNKQFGDLGERIKVKLEETVKNDFTLCELLVLDWDKHLTPWKADANMKGRNFLGNGVELLRNLQESVYPKIREYAGDSKIYIAGYSLAGLFSLWSLYESDMFDGAASCSGSLWYPDWKEFATQNTLKRPVSVYLSLGKAEKKVKHPLMRNVEEHTRFQYELLEQDEKINKLHMDWWEGGHFDHTEDRIAKGIEWLIVNSDIFTENKKVKTVLENPSEHIESEKYFS